MGRTCKMLPHSDFSAGKGGMRDRRFSGGFGILCGMFLLCQVAQAQNLHLIDSSPDGFAIYRSGVPNAHDLQSWCKLGIQEVMVLSGDADSVEGALSPENCPSLRVVHHERQQPGHPVDSAFLQRFDDWVQRARREHKKILFRCQCGCHRTGRLAAYYEMKYMGRTPEQAAVNLQKFGRDMGHYPYLPSQIAALQDYAAGRACRFTEENEKRSYCVQP